MSIIVRFIEDSDMFVRNRIRLVVAEHHPTQPRMSVLMGDGSWQEQEAGTASAEPPGFVLPREAVEVILSAAEEFLGRATHGATEVKVLREWLEHERGRVDAVWSVIPQAETP